MLDALMNILRHRCRVPSGSRVLVGLSGGGDSVALLRLLHEVASSYPLQLHATHLDHALRQDSAADACWVAGLCASLDIPLSMERVEVANLARESGMGVEEAGRMARRRLLSSEAERLGCEVVALGHQRDDQAETVLHRLLRGSSASGLAAMRYRQGLFIRPLLGVSRLELESYLGRLGQDYLSDPSNAEPVFTRNRLRHEVLPLLREFNPRLDGHLAALAGRLAEEESFWEDQVDGAMVALLGPEQGGVRLARAGLAKLHPALARRVLRRALEAVRGHLAGVDSGHLQRLLDLILSGPPQGEMHLPQCWAGVRFGDVVVRQFPPETMASPDLVIPGPGDYSLPDGRVLRLETLPPEGLESSTRIELSLEGIRFPLQVRGFRPGDRISLAGLNGRKKLKELFSEQRIAQELRRGWPLLVGDELLWVIGLRRCGGHRPSGAAEKVLRVTLLQAETLTIRL